MNKNYLSWIASLLAAASILPGCRDRREDLETRVSISQPAPVLDSDYFKKQGYEVRCLSKPYEKVYESFGGRAKLEKLTGGSIQKIEDFSSDGKIIAAVRSSQGSQFEHYVIYHENGETRASKLPYYGEVRQKPCFDDNGNILLAEILGPARLANKNPREIEIYKLESGKYTKAGSIVLGLPLVGINDIERGRWMDDNGKYVNGYIVSGVGEKGDVSYLLLSLTDAKNAKKLAG